MEKNALKKSEQDLIQLVKLWDQAIVSNNVDEINQYVSDDWVIVGTEGGITPKSTFLNFIGSGDLTHTRMDSDEITVRVFENTGVVISRGTSSGTYKLAPFSFYEWSMSVFVFKEKKWSFISTMLTPAND